MLLASDNRPRAFNRGASMKALGRLSDANSIVDFMTTTDEMTAKIFATELEGLNARRRLLCDQVVQVVHQECGQAIVGAKLPTFSEPLI